MSIIIGGEQMSQFYYREDELLQAQERGEVRLITLEALYR